MRKFPIVAKKQIVRGSKSRSQRRHSDRKKSHLLHHIPAEQDFQELLDHLDVGVGFCSRQGKIVYANTRFTEALRVSERRYVRGGNLRFLLPSGCLKQFHVALKRAAAGKAELELKVDGASGGMRTIRLCLTPIRMSRDAQIQIVAIDVTELAHANENLKQTQTSLQSLSARILRVQDEARRRIARDLHDITGQDMSVVAMSLSRITKILGPEASDVRDAVTDALERVRTVEQELRTVSYLLHPPLLDDLGLASALRWYIEGFTKRSGIEVGLEIPRELQRIDTQKEIAIFRIVQESLANVLKHSGSKHATIRLLASGDILEMTVEDAGKGIDFATLAKLKSGHETVGVGIPGMRERLRQLGGNLEMHSSAKGTRVFASVPIADHQADLKPTNKIEAIPLPPVRA